ncbi:hypothetical protein EKH79_15190 [Dyella dinghuensis]|uniref:Uncharacterized protein n=1 Tax=Dyella dinghuensis TaxID=1920169 RepID=A0A3S0WMH9_9GAMM|nr:hypothetical protein [Dyella dinghuensis]RUL62228.1 hypothetical protein EKH79_15190 [Dyella dinghuensis]
MDRQSQSFLEQFNAMDTKLLLQRYRVGGLIPEAEVVLLSVLERRGYSQEKLAEKETLYPASTASPEASLLAKTTRRPSIPNSHPRLRPINRALKCLIIPVLVIFLLLAIPLVGNFVVLGGASLLGCQTGEDNIHPCHFLGWDIGEFVYGYVVDIFVLGGLNPILAFVAFRTFICSPLGMIWLSIVIGAVLVRERMRRRLTMDACLPPPIGKP